MLLSKRDRCIIIYYLRKWTTVCSTQKKGKFDKNVLGGHKIEKFLCT